jgi:RNA polymerase sigma factor (sigma-70 family)
VSESSDEEQSDEGRAAEERALLARVAQGGKEKHAALRALFARYQGSFKARLRIQGFGNADIDEATQRVWTDISHKAGEFSAEGVPRKWLWGFFRNVKNDLLRANARRAHRFVSANDEGRTSLEAPSDDSPLPASDEPSPEARLQARKFKECVDRAFTAFKRQHPDWAFGLYHHYFNGWDVKEIAKVRGSSEGAVREFLSQARKRFQPFVSPCRELMTD